MARRRGWSGERIAGHYACVARTTKFWVVVALVVFAVGSTVWFAAGETSHDSRHESPGTDDATQVHDPDLGITASIPPSWQFARAGVPGGGFSAGNGPVTWSVDSPCTSTDRAHVDLSIRSIEYPSAVPITRPRRSFTRRDGTGLTHDPLLPCGAAEIGRAHV